MCVPGMPKNKQQEAKNAKSKTTSQTPSVFLTSIAHTGSRAGYDLAQARRLHVRETNGRKSDEQRHRSNSLLLRVSASDLFSLAKHDSHSFFGIMRSFFYGILLSVVCFST